MTIARQLLFLAGLCVLALASKTADAQTQRAAPAANSGLVMQMQQLQTERNTLQTENAKLKADLETARKERDALKAAQDAQLRRDRGADSQLATATHERDRLESELQTQKQRTQELVTRLREVSVNARDAETAASTAKQELSSKDQSLKTCVDANQKLYDLNGEILVHLEKRGFLSVVAEREPFTQIKRVQLENLVDSYRGAARDNHLNPAQSH